MSIILGVIAGFVLTLLNGMVNRHWTARRSALIMLVVGGLILAAVQTISTAVVGGTIVGWLAYSMLYASLNS